MAVQSDIGLIDELVRLRAELSRREREAADKELQLQRYAADLRETFKQERARAQELRRSYMATVRALSNAVEARDAYTGKHAERVAAYGIVIARKFSPELEVTPELEFGYLLHDVGKVAIPDAILYKPSSLDDDERALMSRHPVIGAEIVQGIEFLADAAEVVRSHHERWDGTGYPDGLAGEEIPLAARVFSVADVLDALTTDRPYRPASLASLRAGVDHRRERNAVRPPGRGRVQRNRRRGVRTDRGRDSMTAHSPEASGHGVLIVDDDQFIRKLIATTLEDVAEFDLHEAADGVEALEVARRARPTLVFLDVDMPRLNGIETCRQLRADDESGHVTIVMLTAASGDNVESDAEEAGADLFLTKPFSPLDLLRLVDQLGER